MELVVYGKKKKKNYICQLQKNLILCVFAFNSLKFLQSFNFLVTHAKNESGISRVYKKKNMFMSVYKRISFDVYFDIIIQIFFKVSNFERLIQ